MTSAMRILAALAFALLLAAPSIARADDQVRCEFLEISASTTKEGGVPPELKPLEKKLKKPPFSSWNTFKLLGRQERALGVMKAESLKLQLGSASVLLREVDRKAGHKARVALGVTMDDQGGKRVLDTKLSVDGGDYLVIGRSLPSNEGHLLAIACQP